MVEDKDLKKEEEKKVDQVTEDTTPIDNEGDVDGVLEMSVENKEGSQEELMKQLLSFNNGFDDMTKTMIDTFVEKLPDSNLDSSAKFDRDWSKVVDDIKEILTKFKSEVAVEYSRLGISQAEDGEK